MPLDRRARPIDGFLDRPERLIQPQHRQGAEAGGDLRPRNAQQIPHRAQAKPAQSRHRAGIEPQAGDGQIGQGRLSSPDGKNGPVFPGMCQRPGGTGGAGNRQPAGNGIPLQPDGEVLRQLGFAGEHRACSR